MAGTYRRDFETEHEYLLRLDREMQERATFEPDIGKVLEAEPREPASDLVSDTSEQRGGIVERVRVYANGTRITSWSFTDGWTPPRGGDGIKPGSAAASAAFKAGREDEYIDRMRNRFGGEW
jgi:hypothetical protein